MTCLYYTAWGSFVLRRPKNKVKLPTQSAGNRICMGKWAFKIWVELFLNNMKAPDDQIFSGGLYATNRGHIDKPKSEIKN